MRSNKVLNHQQVHWHDGEHTRLSYQMLFKEEEPSEEFDENIDVIEQLNSRDEKWKNKLQVERDKAYRQGLEDGKKSGYAEARKEMDEKISIIKAVIDQGHLEWKTRQKILDPGLLDLSFDIAESILGIPVENEAIQAKLKQQLIPLFQKLDDQSKPVIKVNSSDLDYVKALKTEFAEKVTVHIVDDENCNPGEFEVETNEEIVVHKFRETLKDFKAKLMLPTWNK